MFNKILISSVFYLISVTSFAFETSETPLMINIENVRTPKNINICQNEKCNISIFPDGVHHISIIHKQIFNELCGQNRGDVPCTINFKIYGEKPFAIVKLIIDKKSDSLEIFEFQAFDNKNYAMLYTNKKNLKIIEK